jgi:succinate-acetate transporter protein
VATNRVKDTTGNPAPLGLFAFAMTTILRSLHNAGLLEINTMILGMGLFYGGRTQLIIGALEGKKGNPFGTVANSGRPGFWGPETRYQRLTRRRASRFSRAATLGSAATAPGVLARAVTWPAQRMRQSAA